MIRLLLILLLLAGCRLPQPTPSHQSSAFHYYPVLPPVSYGRSVGIEQHLEGQFHTQPFQLHIRLEIDPAQILVVGFTSFQTRAFVMRYDGRNLEFETFTDRSLPFPPEMILSDIQQVLWPALPNRRGWRVVDDTTANIRRVFFADQLVTRIQYNGTSPTTGTVALSNLKYGYQLHIRTVNVEDE